MSSPVSCSDQLRTPGQRGQVVKVRRNRSGSWNRWGWGTGL